MQTNSKKVLVSILNWNSSKKTIECVNSVLVSNQNTLHHIKIRVVDNNSSPNEVQLLKAGLHKSVETVFMCVNTGFAGGQNINIQHAVAQQYDYIWLLNNDTLVPPNTIDEILSLIDSDSKCGAASPVVVRINEPSIIDFCGAIHAWQNLGSIRPTSIDEAAGFLRQNPDEIWAVGTALMIKTKTIKDVGYLNESLFAYFEDDDFGARMKAAGWHTRIALNARVEHECFDGDISRRPAYYFYLMNRNAVIFASDHAPMEYRKFMRLRFIDRSIFLANTLRQSHQPEKADACLLGLADGLAGKGGPPNLNRKVPLWLRALQPVGRMWNLRRRRA